MISSSFGSVKFQQHRDPEYRYGVEVASIPSVAADAAGFISSWITCVLCIVLYALSTFAPQLSGANKEGLKVLPLQALEVFTMPVSSDAITEHERQSIITSLAECGKWEGQIAGAQVQFIRDSNRSPMVRYSAEYRGRSSSNWRITPEAAIEACIDQLYLFGVLKDPETHILPIRLWGSECGRGFVRSEMFGPGQRVIAGTNRNVSRKWRALGEPS